MSRQRKTNGEAQHRLDELKTLRDQIRLDLHLASMELRDEWKEIERKLPDPAQALEQIETATNGALDSLGTELRRFRARLRGGGVRVDDIMARDPACCGPDDSLAQALTTMWHRDIGCLPVVDRDGQVLGMLTDRDAAIAAATRGQRMDDISVASAMSTKVVACAPGQSLRDALGLMRGRHVRRLPVVGEDGKLRGVVTLADVARALRGAPEKPHGGADASAFVNVFAAIVEPAESGVTNAS